MKKLKDTPDIKGGIYEFFWHRRWVLVLWGVGRDWHQPSHLEPHLLVKTPSSLPPILLPSWVARYLHRHLRGRIYNRHHYPMVQPSIWKKKALHLKLTWALSCYPSGHITHLSHHFHKVLQFSGNLDQFRGRECNHRPHFRCLQLQRLYTYLYIVKDQYYILSIWLNYFIFF